MLLFSYSALLRKTEYIAIGQDRGGGKKKGHVKDIKHSVQFKYNEIKHTIVKPLI